MQLKVEIAARTAFPKSELFAMHRLRAKVFSGRMGWEVPIMSGMEIDGYDAMDPYYMMMREEGGILRGCWRLLPTVGPYMLKDSFPAFLHDHKNGIAHYVTVTATAIERMLRRAGVAHPDLLN